jgi:peptidoglycan DL-endopeptidase CwlO
MRRLVFAFPYACVALLGCAAGRPLGAMSVWGDGQWRGFSPAAMPREVPEPPPEGQAAAPKVPHHARERTVEIARSLVGKEQIVVAGKEYPADCSGLIRGLYERLGVNVLSDAKQEDNAVTAIYRYAEKHGRIYTGGRPVAGDLVFFRDTYDLNRDGRENDGLTHVAIVSDVEEDGTVHVIHHVKDGVRRYRMNLTHRDAWRATDGHTWNDWLRPAGIRGPAQLTSQLFAAYATLLPVEPRYTASR